MPKKSELPLEVATIRLFEGDKQTLIDFYKGPGYNLIIRALVHNLCKKLRETESRKEITNDGTDSELLDGLDLDALGSELT